MRRQFCSLDNLVSTWVLHNDSELQGRVQTGELLVLEVSTGSILATVTSVTFSREEVILILDLKPTWGELISVFPHSGTLYLVWTLTDV